MLAKRIRVRFIGGAVRYYNAEDYIVCNGPHDSAPHALQLRKSDDTLITIAGGTWESVEIGYDFNETEQIVKS